MANRPPQNQNIINLAIFTLIVMALVLVIAQSADFSSPAFIYGILASITILIYLVGQYQPYLLGISTKNALRLSFYAMLVGAVFYFGAKIFPSFSIISPILPAAVSGELKIFVILFLAPIVETIVFQGAIMGYIYAVTKNEKFAVVGQAITFALFHLGAYVVGLNLLPTLSAAGAAFLSNLSGFIAAFVFALIAGIIVINKNVKNLVFVMVLHFILNLILYTTFAVVVS